MKWTKRWIATVSCVFLAIALVGVVIASGILSNHIEKNIHVFDTNVTATEIAINTANSPGGDKPALGTSGVNGASYDQGITLNVNAATGDPMALTFVFTKVAVGAGDVTVQYYNYGTSSWTPISMVKSGDTLSGGYDPFEGQIPVKGDSQTCKMIFTFNAGGDYALDEYVVG